MDWLLIGAMLTAFFILGVARLTTCIRIVALQGALLSFLPAFAKGSLTDPHGLFLILSTLVIKAVLIPTLLLRSIQKANIRLEVEPLIRPYLSLLVGGAIALLAFSSMRVLPKPGAPFPPLVTPAALSIVLVGFLLLVSRTKAVTQVIGFLILENGIFLFGMTLVTDFPLTVELGVLLDLLVGVFVMGIMVYHINRTFDHIDTKVLSKLGDA